MTKEDKELLLKDICGRLPYGLKVYYWEPVNLLNPQYERKQGNLIDIDTRLSCNFIIERDNNFFRDSIETTKPYLRPMSSMTEEEYDEYHEIETTIYSTKYEALTSKIDWLNAHHFDYRGLIEMGLAVEAPEDLYKI